MSKFNTREEDCATWARVETSPYEIRGSTMIRKSGYRISSVLAIVSFLAFYPSSSSALEANPSGLWFGGDKGIEVVFRTGKNLAYTEDNPKVDPRMR